MLVLGTDILTFSTCQELNIGFVGKLVKNPIFKMVRKVAGDEYVEDYFANHAMEHMEDFQTWYLQAGSQPIIVI